MPCTLAVWTYIIRVAWSQPQSRAYLVEPADIGSQFSENISDSIDFLVQVRLR